MKPLKLKIEAFGSYIKPVTLDFEKNLRDEKIFLIQGATGAGKTTILDAICFALYGTASGDERDAAMMRSKGISEKILTEVEFTFALGEKTYTVYRNLNFKGDKKAKLIFDKEIIESKSTAVTNRIKELVGFDAKQFRQVVLLPQGEFKTFLSAKSDERQPILDALFNARFYKLIEDKLKAKADAAQEIFDDLERDRKNLTVQLQGTEADSDALAKILADYAAAQKKSAELKKIFDAAQREYTDGKILAGDFAESERREKNLVAAKNDLAQAEKIFAAAKTEYDLREGEQSWREKLKSDTKELAKIKTSLTDLKKKNAALTEAEKLLQAAEAALKKLEDEAKRFDIRLAELKKQRDELSGAEKALAEAQTMRERANDRRNILREISKLERQFAATQREIFSAEKFFSEAEIDQKRLEKLQRDGSAARLAKNLRDGEPCPVCGSKVHVHVDFGDTIVPSDAEIAAAKSETDRRKKVLDGKKNSAASIEGQLTSKRDELKKFSDLPDDAEVQRIFDAANKNAAALADCEARIAKGEECIAKNKSQLEDAQKNLTAASNAKIKLATEVQTLKDQIDEKYLDNPQQVAFDLAEMEKTLRELETAWRIADKNFRDAGNKKSSCEGAFKSAQAAQRELADKIQGKQPPDIAALKNLTETAQKNYDSAIREETSLKSDSERLKNISAQLAELEEKISAAEKTLLLWKKLSDAANGKIRGNKLSFARYYLSAMFEQVLTEANYLLEKMSDRRYSFKSKFAGNNKNSVAGLNLEIFDDFTGETRHVATLSGGESFLASLSLALGLAAVVRNNLGGIKLETIFIDEGFGSLDNETLDFAISAIKNLSGGRLVGIISHVEELKKQIPVRLEVTTSKTGSKAEFKRGLSRD